MALTIGELVGYISLEDKGFASGVNSAEKGLNRLQSETTSTMASVESKVVKSLSDIERKLAEGLDPTKAIADLDKLEAALDQSLADMVAEADKFGDELDRAVEDAFKPIADTARDAGRDAADGLGDGIDGHGKGRLKGVGSNFIGVLKAAPWIAAGAAIGGMLMEGLSSAMDAQKAKAKLFAQLGTTPAESKKIGKAAGQAYADGYGESMSDVTEAMKSVLQNMDGMRGASSKSLKNVSERAMDVATVMDQDVGGVTKAVSQMLRTGIAKNAEEAFDILVKGTQTGVDKSGDLLDTFNEYSTHFRDLGLSSKDALTIMSQALKGGARDSDQVADGLKELSLRVRGLDTNAVPALKKLGLNADTMAAAFSKGGPAARTAFQTIMEKLKAVKDPTERYQLAVALFGTKAEDMAKAIDGIDLTKGSKEIGKVGGAAKNAGDELHNTASDKVEKFKRGIEQSVVNFIGDQVLPAMEKFWGSFKNSEVADEIGATGDHIAEKLGGIKDKIATWVQNNKDKIDELKEKFKGSFSKISEAVQAAVDFISEIWDRWGDDIMTVVVTVVGWIVDNIGGMFETIGGIFKAGTSLIKGDWGGVWDGVKQIFSGATAGIRSIADTFMRNLVGDWNGGWDKMKEAHKLALKDAEKTLGEWGTNAINAVKDSGKWLVQAGKDLIQGLINGIKSKVTDAVNSVKSLGTSVINAAKAVFDQNSPSKVFAEIGKWNIEGFIKGITSNQERARTTMTNFSTMIKNAFQVRPGAPDALVDWVKGETKRLEDLAKKREEIIQRIADAKKYADQIAQQMSSFASVANLGLGEGAGSSDIVGGLNAKLQQIKQFANDIKKLAESGLNKTTLQQIIEAGPEKGLSIAEMLVGADGSEIKAINKAQKQIDKVSKQVGKTSADALYDVGKNAGDGFLKGLQGKLKETESMMAKIAKAVVAAAKKELGVKSPSRVFMGIGDNTMLGYAKGVISSGATAVAAMSSVMKNVIGQAAGMQLAMPSGLDALAAGPRTPAWANSGAGLVRGYGPDSGVGHNGVVINMPDAVIREEADIGRLGSQFGFELRSRG